MLAMHMGFICPLSFTNPGPQHIVKQALCEMPLPLPPAPR